jgi:hypothetical protein
MINGRKGRYIVAAINPTIRFVVTAVFMAPSFPLAANRVAQNGKTPLIRMNGPTTLSTNVQVPNCPLSRLLVRRSVKTKPVIKLIICAANIMKPEYRTLISDLASSVPSVSLEVSSLAAWLASSLRLR